MGAVVRDDRRFGLGVFFLDGADLFLGHIDRREDKINVRGDRLDLGDVAYRHAGHLLRHRHGHLPLVADRFRVGLAGASCARGDLFYLKPRMVLQNLDKPLTDHSGSAKYSNLQLLFHNKPPSLYRIQAKTVDSARTSDPEKLLNKKSR